MGLEFRCSPFTECKNLSEVSYKPEKDAHMIQVQEAAPISF